MLTRKIASAIAASATLSENEKLRTSIQYIDTFYDPTTTNSSPSSTTNSSTTLQNSSSLSSILERRALQTHEMLLAEFTRVNSRLESMSQCIRQLNDTCHVMQERLDLNREHSAKFLSRIQVLNDAIAETMEQHTVSKQFLVQYQLTSSEKWCIFNGKVNAQFFATLNKVHDIYTSCTEMLRSEQHRAALEILEEMSNFQDTAYERLSRWIQKKCRYLAHYDDGITGDDNAVDSSVSMRKKMMKNRNHGENCDRDDSGDDNDGDIDDDDGHDNDSQHMMMGEFIVEEELKCALEALAERPVLLNCCINEIKNARRSSLIHRFIRALKHGTERHGARRPIEMQLHDPLRYVGDLLAWVHQAAAAERELIDTILSVDHQGKNKKNETMESLLREHGIDVGSTSASARNDDNSDDMDHEATVASVEEGNEEKKHEEDDHSTNITTTTNKRNSISGSAQQQSSSQSLQRNKIRLLYDILNDTFKELVPHLEDCIKQVLKSWNKKENLVIVFRVAHVLELYAFTIGKLLGDRSCICELLMQLKETSMERFFHVLEKNVREITHYSPSSLSSSRSPTTPTSDGKHHNNNSPVSDDTTMMMMMIPDDLSPPELIQDMMEKLNEIMNTYNQSVVPEDRREQDFNHVLSAVVDPLLHKLEHLYHQSLQQQQQQQQQSAQNNSAESSIGRSTLLPSKRSPARSISDVHVFVINCYFLMQNALGNFTFTTRKVEQIVSTMDKHVELFIEHLSDSLLTQCGIAEKIALIRSHSGSSSTTTTATTATTPLSQVPGLEQATLAEFLQKFYGDLFSLGSQLLMQKQCYQITSARLRVYTQNKIASSLTSAYSLLHAAIFDTANEYDKPEEFAYYTPQQVITLLE